MPLLNIRFFKFSQKSRTSRVSDSWKKRHKCLIICTTVAFIILGLASPYTYTVKEQAIVATEERVTLSSQAPGTISHIYVKSGQSVSAGDKLVQLRNPELEAYASIAKIEFEQAKLLLLQLKANPNWQSNEQAISAQEILKSARTALVSSMHHLDSLTIKSPIDGKVLSPNLDRLTGVFIPEATPLIKIENTQNLKLLIPVSEQSIRHLSVGNKVTGTWIATGKPLRATITNIPTQKASFPHDYFEAIYTRFGGPAPKQQFQSIEEAAQINYPIYIAEASIDSDDAYYHQGMRVFVIIKGERTRFIFRIKESIDQLFD